MRGCHWYQPDFVTGQELLDIVTGDYLVRITVLADFDLLHEILLRWRINGITSIERTIEVLEGEGVIEVISEGVVQDTVLWVSIVSKQDWVELAAVLLRHPVNAIGIDSWRLHHI